MDYTKELFRDLYWNYIEAPYETAEAFKEALRTYHKSIGYKGTYPKIKWDENTINSPKVMIAAIVLPLEEYEEAREHIETLEAANGKYFTALDLLYQTHNKIGSPILGDRDNHFFEGFAFAVEEKFGEEKIPVYVLITGS